MNSSTCHTILDGTKSCFFQNTPFYYSHKPALIDGLSDHRLILGAPIIAYWSLSLFFHYLDMSGWKWLEKYRIHDSAEVQSRNLATRSQVVWAVLFQQLIQTLLGVVWMSDESSKAVNHEEAMQAIGQTLQPIVRSTIGETRALLPSLAYVIYWWAIPVFQFLGAM